jgi:hypothetical protein
MTVQNPNISYPANLHMKISCQNIHENKLILQTKCMRYFASTE